MGQRREEEMCIFHLHTFNVFFLNMAQDFKQHVPCEKKAYELVAK